MAIFLFGETDADKAVFDVHREVELLLQERLKSLVASGWERQKKLPVHVRLAASLVLLANKARLNLNYGCSRFPVLATTLVCCRLSPAPRATETASPTQQRLPFRLPQRLAGCL